MKEQLFVVTVTQQVVVAAEDAERAADMVTESVGNRLFTLNREDVAVNVEQMVAVPPAWDLEDFPMCEPETPDMPIREWCRKGGAPKLIQSLNELFARFRRGGDES